MKYETWEESVRIIGAALIAIPIAWAIMIFIFPAFK